MIPTLNIPLFIKHEHGTFENQQKSMLTTSKNYEVFVLYGDKRKGKLNLKEQIHPCKKKGLETNKMFDKIYLQETSNRSRQGERRML